MEITEVKREKEEGWNNFIKENDCSFLQSWAWGGFQETVGKNVFRLALIENGEWLGVAQVIVNRLPLKKSWFYIPRGMVKNAKCKMQNAKVWFELLKYLKTIAKKEKAIFLKIEPPIGDLILPDSFKKSKDIQPARTIFLNLNADEEDLLAGMSQKTRYNIKLAGKKGVKIVRIITGVADEFWRLIKKTSERDGFTPHTEKYYRKMLETLPETELWAAEYKGKIIAANIVGFFGQTAVYMHGASDYEFRNLMAPHLLQWEQIKGAKKRGCECYDFWGIDEDKWPGVTRFKKGFGGREVNYPGAYEYIFSNFWWGLYSLGKKLKQFEIT